MNEFILIIVIVSFILALILINPIFGFLKALRLKAKIPFSRCLMMSMRKTLKTELIKAVAFSQEKSINIDINVLEAHFLAGGSPLKCLEAIEYAKNKNLELDFKLVSAAELAGKDLLEAVDKTHHILKINVSGLNIRDSKLKATHYDYKGNFKIDFGRACFASPDNEKTESEVKEKIQKYIEYADTSDRINTGKIINETILDTKFWESKGLNLINQEIKID